MNAQAERGELTRPTDAEVAGSSGKGLALDGGDPRVRHMSERELSALASADLVLIAAGGGIEAECAWRLLVERHARVVWKVVRCFGLPNEASWEAYQSTWLRAIERLSTLRDPASFGSWVGTIARHEALSVIRARKKVVPSVSPLEGIEDGGPPPGERLQRDELCRTVREGFACLPQGCQDLLRLLTADPPVAYSEIERLLAMSHGSIGPTRRRCLDKLRNTAAMVAYLGSER